MGEGGREKTSESEIENSYTSVVEDYLGSDANTLRTLREPYDRGDVTAITR